MAIPQGVRMAGQVLGALGGVAKAYPAQAALVGTALAAPPVLGYTHGRVAGYNDPSKGGLGGTVGYGFFGSPIAGLAYGLGHQGGREAATGSNDISGETPITTGSGNVIIGKACQAHSASASTVIVMGFECTATGNENFTFGKGSTDSNIAFGGTSISAPSDERYKENIETSTAGLSFINDLRPVTFKWKMEKDVPSDHKAYVKDSTTRVMSAKDEFYHGFIAQEVKAAIDKHSEVKNYDGLWAENIDGRQRVAPAELIPMLTKAVQELSAKNDALEARIKKLEDG